jgi:hypothetical protein
MEPMIDRTFAEAVLDATAVAMKSLVKSHSLFGTRAMGNTNAHKSRTTPMLKTSRDYTDGELASFEQPVGQRSWPFESHERR